MSENQNKSTGPRTPEGKAISSRNHFKHGLSVNQILIPGEDSEAFESLIDNLEEDHKPANATEVLLVHDLAKFHWLKNRALRLQQKAFENPDAIDTRLLEVMMRYQNANQRQFANTLKNLQGAQKERVRREIEFESQQPVEMVFGPYYAAGQERPPAVESAADKQNNGSESQENSRIFLRPPGKLA
jgi:hypothetical protein